MSSNRQDFNVYVASSWRNETQPVVVTSLRQAGFTVYDFRHPNGRDSRGFSWAEIDPTWPRWTPEQFQRALEYPYAQQSFAQDYEALLRADAVVLVSPCGRSSHLELGFAAGRGKPTSILLDAQEPELMYHLADYLATDIEAIVQWLVGVFEQRQAEAEPVLVPLTVSDGININFQPSIPLELFLAVGNAVARHYPGATVQHLEPLFRGLAETVSTLALAAKEA